MQSLNFNMHPCMTDKNLICVHISHTAFMMSVSWNTEILFPTLVCRQQYQTRTTEIQVFGLALSGFEPTTCSLHTYSQTSFRLRHWAFDKYQIPNERDAPCDGPIWALVIVRERERVKTTTTYRSENKANLGRPQMAKNSQPLNSQRKYKNWHSL